MMASIMQPADVLDWAKRLGIALWVTADGNKVRFAPAAAAPPDFVAALRVHKQALIRLLPREDVCASPFAQTPAQAAEAVDAWLRAGRPGDYPVATGLTLLRLRGRWRTGAAG